VPCVNVRVGGMGCTTGLRNHHDLSPPRGGHNVPQPLPHEEVRRSTTRRGQRGERHGDTPPAPTRHAPDPRHPTRLRIRHTVVRRRSPGRVPAALAWPGALPDASEDASGRQKERTERGRRSGPSLRVLVTCTPHPHSRPRVERGWHLQLASRARALARIAPQRHQHPPAD
jgi:hypothetical protein